MDDLLIRGGELIDGTGLARRRSDVCVSNGRIVEVTPDSTREARRVIDATGHIVAPGFIDIHTHSDFTLQLNPKAESKIRQGVTTEVVGNCGFSAAPVLPGNSAMLKEYLSHSAPWLTFRDTTFKEYLQSYPATSVNVVHLVGHHTLRLMTVGMERRPASPDELQAMVGLLEEALDAGAIGMSSGLFTAPGAFANAEEFVTLGRVLAARDALYATHVRDEGRGVFEAVAEAIDVARRTGVRTQISHLGAKGTDNWGRAQELLDLIEAARKEGIRIECDQHPYTTGSYPLRNFLPIWAHEGGIDVLVERPDFRLHHRGPANAHADCSHGPARRGHDHGHALGACGVRRQLACGARCHEPGHAPSAFLWDARSHTWPLRPGTRSPHARRCNPQDDRRQREGARLDGSRPRS